MPQMANITVKKADGTTDVLYTAVSPAAGDRAPAVWKNQTVGTTPAQRPIFTLSSADNGTKKARRFRTTFIWPKVKTDAGGNIIVSGGANGDSNHLIPQDMTPAEIAEYVSQYAGLLFSALVKASMNDGYAPN